MFLKPSQVLQNLKNLQHLKHLRTSSTLRTCRSMSSSHSWWIAGPTDPAHGPPPGPPQGPLPPVHMTEDLTTLGWMKLVRHIYFHWYEYQYLRFLHTCLTRDWWIIQGGVDAEALAKWHQIFEVLELDRKARRDFMLLVHSGLPGRAEANEIMWSLLSYWALQPQYRNLSSKTSQLILRARKRVDRPPRAHSDRHGWTWSFYAEPRHPNWSPLAVPRPGTWELLTGPGGLPLPPPECWGPVIRWF